MFLCYSVEECSAHLFLFCPYAGELWRAVGSLFGFPVPHGNGTLLSMFEARCEVSCSSQVRPLWMTTVISVFRIVWQVRNRLIC